MEITKSPDGFKPFFIRIDSKNEAEFLWHLLNNDSKISFVDYLKEENLKENWENYSKLKSLFYNKLQEKIQKQILEKEVQEWTKKDKEK